MKCAVSEFFNFQWKPAYAMADSAGAIQNALKRVFPDIEVANCYFHMRQVCFQRCSTKNDLMEKLKHFNSSSLPLQQEKFETYLERTSAFYVLEQIPPNGIIHFSCTCYRYHSYASCKHSLGCSIYFGKTIVPFSWTAEKLSDRSKVGRPKKAPQNCLQKCI